MIALPPTTPREEVRDRFVRLLLANAATRVYVIQGFNLAFGQFVALLSRDVKWRGNADLPVQRAQEEEVMVLAANLALAEVEFSLYLLREGEQAVTAHQKNTQAEASANLSPEELEALRNLTTRGKTSH